MNNESGHGSSILRSIDSWEKVKRLKDEEVRG